MSCIDLRASLSCTPCAMGSKGEEEESKNAFLHLEMDWSPKETLMWSVVGDSYYNSCSYWHDGTCSFVLFGADIVERLMNIAKWRCFESSLINQD